MIPELLRLVKLLARAVVRLEESGRHVLSEIEYRELLDLVDRVEALEAKEEK